MYWGVYIYIDIYINTQKYIVGRYTYVIEQEFAIDQASLSVGIASIVIQSSVHLHMPVR